MKTSDLQTLQALVKVLTNPDQALDADLESEISQVIKSLREIISKSQPLQERYEEALAELAEHYLPQSKKITVESDRKNLSTFLMESAFFGSGLDLSRTPDETRNEVAP
jgi:flagellar biosynthesis/type III secretory pathway protein FliH